MSRPRVFVLFEDQRQNYNSAEQYGEIHVVTNRDFTNTPNSVHNRNVLRDIKRRFITRYTEDDWILLSAAPLVNAAAFMMLAQAGVTCVRVLRWSNRDFMYYPVAIDITQAEYTEND